VNTEPLQDNDGKILIGILGGSSEKLLIIKKEGEKQHIELTDDGIAKLNYILNRVARHTRRNGIGLPFFKKYLEPRCKIEQDYDSNKKKVYFCIKDVKKFRTFLNYLTTFKDIDQFDDSKDHAAFILNEKKALFIKNLLCFIDLEKDEVFKERRALFQKVIQSVF
jgi:hypothetical protein